MDWLRENWLYVVVFLFVIGVAGLVTYEQATCARWEKTDGLTCTTIGSITTCEPTKVCVERK
jgi:hypothetical protein